MHVRRRYSILTLVPAATAGLLGVASPVDAARTATASWETTLAETRTVTGEVRQGAGTVVASDISCGEDCVGSYAEDTVVRILAYPSEGRCSRGGPTATAPPARSA